MRRISGDVWRLRPPKASRPRSWIANRKPQNSARFSIANSAPAAPHSARSSTTFKPTQQRGFEPGSVRSSSTSSEPCERPRFSCASNTQTEGSLRATHAWTSDVARTTRRITQDRTQVRRSLSSCQSRSRQATNRQCNPSLLRGTTSKLQHKLGPRSASTGARCALEARSAPTLSHCQQPVGALTSSSIGRPIWRGERIEPPRSSRRASKRHSTTPCSLRPQQRQAQS